MKSIMCSTGEIVYTMKHYLSTDHWLIKRTAALARANNLCERCGSSENLTCHHHTYAGLGDERLDDLEILCWTCHRKAHHANEVDINHGITSYNDWRRIATPKRGRPLSWGIKRIDYV